MHPCADGAAAKAICALLCSANGDSISAAVVARNIIASEMNKHERQGREPADQTTLPDDIGRELSRITTEVIDVGDAPPIAPPAPLTQDEVRTILMSLLLTMFLAALDQTIVATALPTIGAAIQRRQQSFLGDHGLSAGVDRSSTGVRHAERHLWPPRHDHRFACPVHGRLDPVRRGTQHDSADCRARPAGAWAAAASCRSCRP